MKWRRRLMVWMVSSGSETSVAAMAEDTVRAAEQLVTSAWNAEQGALAGDVDTRVRVGACSGQSLADDLHSA